MRRRWPLVLFGIIWLTVLVTPSLRLWLMAQTIAPAAPYFGFGYGPAWMSESGGSASPLPESDDPAILVQALDEAKDARGYNLDTPEKLRQLDGLIARFPDQIWIRAKRMRETQHWMLSRRAVTNGLDNFAPQQWQAAYTIAQGGAAREPQNGYWNWCLTRLLLDAKRDREALAQLHRAAHAPRFAMHERESTRARLQAEAARHNRALLPEERLIWLIDEASSPSVVTQSRILSKLAKAAEARGDHQTAINIALDWASFGLRAAEGSYNSNAAYYWEWHALTPMRERSAALNLRKMRIDSLSRTEWTRKVTAHFLPYAAAHGRDAQARDVTQQLIAQAQQRDAIRAKDDNYWFLDRAVFRRLLTLNWAASNLLWLLAMALPLWGVLTISCRACGVAPCEISKRDRFATTLLGTVALLLLAAAVPSEMGWNYFPWGLLSGDLEPSVYSGVSLFVLIFGAFLALLLPVAWSGLAVGRRARKENQKRKPFTLGDALRGGVNLLLLGFLCGALYWWSYIALYNSGPSLARAGGGDWWGKAHPLWPMALFTMTLAISWLARLTTPSPFTAYRLRWLQQALGALIVLSSAFYLAFNLASLPLRERAEGEVNTLLHNGSNTLMRRAITAKSGI
jgi:hypothetical protein